MQREVIPFTTEEAWLAHRAHDLTSSDIPILFNVGYGTYENLFQAKLNHTQNPFTPNERVSWGVALEQAIAVKFAKDNGWDIRKKSEYIRIKELRIGSSFDYEIQSEDEDDKGEAHSVREILEIKTVDAWEFKQKWITGFEIQATPYIEIQVQHQLLVSGLETAYIGVLIGGNEGKILKRMANKKIQDAILFKAEEFWRRIDEAKQRTS